MGSCPYNPLDCLRMHFLNQNDEPLIQKKREECHLQSRLHQAVCYTIRPQFQIGEQPKSHY